MVCTDRIFAFTFLNANFCFLLPTGNFLAADADGVSCVAPSAAVRYGVANSMLIFLLANSAAGHTAVNLTVVDNAYQYTDREISVASNSTILVAIDISASGRWYDFSVYSTAAALSGGSGATAAHACFFRRFMGRMENGEDSTSDPAMGGE